jgi:HSP20 family molecular chaperone IbpA
MMPVPFSSLNEELESLADQINYRFFNHNDRLFKHFAAQNRRILKALPFNGIKRPCVHYGGDYIVTLDDTQEDGNDDHYFFHFLIPGHDETSIEVIQKEGYIIIKARDKDEEKDNAHPFTDYKYYKKVGLTHPDFEVTEAIFKNGILSLAVRDMIAEREKINTKTIEVKNQ